jgi:pimeloyl-ACP methyl ester carboxylesterase
LYTNVKFVYFRQNPTSRQVLTHNNQGSVTGSNYRGTRGTKVIVHGWNNNGDTEMNPLITSAFLAIEDVNVIVVDWRALASSSYNTAAAGVPNVGQHLGNFLIWLFNTAGGSWSNVHLVGFSLGAHIVGNAGRQAGGRPSRVTGRIFF